MKKIFTLSAAVCAAAGMWAAQPQAVVAENAAQAQQQPSFATAAVSNSNVKATEALMPSAQDKASREQTLQVAYRVPAGTMYPWMKLTTETGFSWPMRMSALLPAYTEMTWQNLSNNGRTDEGIQWLDSNFKWMQIDPQTNKPATGDNAKTFSTDVDWVQNTTQSMWTDYGQYAPYLKYGAYGYYDRYEDSNNAMQPMFYQIGGSSQPDDETLQSWQDAFPLGVEPWGAMPISPYSDELGGTQWLGCYDFVDYEEYFNDAVAEEYPTMTNANCVGFAEQFTVASPMILRSITFNGLLRSNGPLHVDMDLLDANTHEVIATSSCDVEAKPGDDTTGDWTTFYFPFTSIQGIDEVDYIHVNSDFVAVIKGFQGTPDIVGGAPVCMSYKYYLRLPEGNVRVNTVNVVPQIIGYWATGTLDGEQVEGMVTEGHVWGQQNGDYYWLPCAFMMCADMDFPFVQPIQETKKINGTWGDWTELDITDYREVVLDQANTKLQYEWQIGCPAPVEEVSITTAEGEDLPEWLSVWAEDAKDVEDKDEGQKYFYAGMYLADGYTAAPESVDVVMNYYGRTQTFHVVASQGGVENVADDAEVVSSKYFDMQGRTLVGEPAQGLYIRQDALSNGTVRNSKLVK